MYYSRLLLNLSSSRARRDIADDFEMHRTVMSVFPSIDNRERQNPDSGSILWRVDHDHRRGIVMLIVQSEAPPGWTPLLKRYPGYLSSPPDSDLPPVATMERQLTFRTGQRLTFRLRANPTRKVRVDGRKNGKRCGLTTHEEQRVWLQRKATDENHPTGFQLVNCVLAPHTAPRRKPTAKVAGNDGTAATRQLAHVSALFEGLLEVTDPNLFRQTVRAGIGSAKAFGFGLLSVARV